VLRPLVFRAHQLPAAQDDELAQRARRARVVAQHLEQPADAEAVERRAEQHRRLAPRAIAFRIKGGGRAAHQLDLGGYAGCILAEQLVRRARV